MRLRTLLAGLTILLTGTALPAQIIGDVLGVHSFGPGTKSPIVGARPDSCAYCHAPHSGLNRGLWNQKLTTQVYTLYSSKSEVNKGNQPILGSDSNQCLSCHDGTVAVGNTVAYGQVMTTGTMNTWDVFGSTLQSSHPFSMRPLQDSVDLFESLTSTGKTHDPTGAVKLIQGDVECTSCHNPHVQAKDLVSLNFLVTDSSSGQMCLDCHDPTRQKGGQVNPLADWPTSAHAMATAVKISPSALLGSYNTVAGAACIACHTPHNANGPARLLRGQNEQDCIACHNGANVSPMKPYANVFSEYDTSKSKVGHPFPASTNPHEATEDTLLNNNRHATCVDCHNGHGSEVVDVFPIPPLIRVSQKNIAGINASNGINVLTPAINQYDNCLRCHGNSTGKQKMPIYGYFPMRAVALSDSLNLIPQFATSAISSHPVMHGRTSTLPQPSLLATMLDIYGNPKGRVMGTQILCTDCHNSDDNREFGGGGPNGPHGSIYPHILEHRYEFSQAVTPGDTIIKTYPGPDLTVFGPYGLCAKCHDLSILQTSSSSWSGHSEHISTLGISCSACHTAHGNVAGAGPISGERLVNFDLNVVAPNGVPVSYNQSTNSCVLVCHKAAHNPGGGVTKVAARGPVVKK